MTERQRVVRRIRTRYGVARGPACLYLLHFERPFHHAAHYLGFTGRAGDLETRLQAHRTGRGARLLAATLAAGIGFEVALTVRLPLCHARTVERRLKDNGNSTRLCPLCAAATRARRTETQRRRRAARREEAA